MNKSIKSIVKVLIVVVIFVIIIFWASSLNKNFKVEVEDNPYKIDKPGWNYNEKYEFNQNVLLDIKKYNDLEFKNFRFRLYNDKTYIIWIDVTNNSTEGVYHEAAKIVLLNNNREEIGSAVIPLVDIKSGDTENDIYVRYENGAGLEEVYDYTVTYGELIYD